MMLGLLPVGFFLMPKADSACSASSDRDLTTGEAKEKGREDRRVPVTILKRDRAPVRGWIGYGVGRDGWQSSFDVLGRDDGGWMGWEVQDHRAATVGKRREERRMYHLQKGPAN